MTPLSFVWVGCFGWTCLGWTCVSFCTFRCVWRQFSHSDKVIFLSLLTSQYRGIFLPQRRSFLEILFNWKLSRIFDPTKSYLFAVTSSLNVFHSRRSQTLFLFLSRRTKLNVAIFSSSVPHFVLLALRKNWWHVKTQTMRKIPEHTPSLCLAWFAFWRTPWDPARTHFSADNLASFGWVRRNRTAAAYPLCCFQELAFRCLRGRTNNNPLSGNTELFCTVRPWCIPEGKVDPTRNLS